MKVVFGPDAERDLESIADRISEDNPRRAFSFVAELREQALSLGRWPLRYPAIGDDPRLRRAPYGAYNIHYLLLEDRVVVWRIVHSAQIVDLHWPTD